MLKMRFPSDCAMHMCSRFGFKSTLVNWGFKGVPESTQLCSITNVLSDDELAGCVKNKNFCLLKHHIVTGIINKNNPILA